MKPTIQLELQRKYDGNFAAVREINVMPIAFN
jgi:hypothetical protein